MLSGSSPNHLSLQKSFFSPLPTFLLKLTSNQRPILDPKRKEIIFNARNMKGIIQIFPLKKGSAIYSLSVFCLRCNINFIKKYKCYLDIIYISISCLKKHISICLLYAFIFSLFSLFF
jgi:hypothetical protein